MSHMSELDIVVKNKLKDQMNYVIEVINKHLDKHIEMEGGVPLAEVFDTILDIKEELKPSGLKVKLCSGCGCPPKECDCRNMVEDE